MLTGWFMILLLSLRLASSGNKFFAPQARLDLRGFCLLHSLGAETGGGLQTAAAGGRKEASPARLLAGQAGKGWIYQLPCDYCFQKTER